jgi:predicted outer membrane lipoprotein
MNRLVLGILLGVAFGVIDVVLTLSGEHPERTPTMLLQAFSSRFAIGVVSANIVLPMHPALAGALVGVLISLPDAFALHSYVGIIGTGLIFGAVGGWIAQAWGAQTR